jgi:hypothetical protein
LGWVQLTIQYIKIITDTSFEKPDKLPACEGTLEVSPKKNTLSLIQIMEEPQLLANDSSLDDEGLLEDYLLRLWCIAFRR